MRDVFLEFGIPDKACWRLQRTLSRVEDRESAGAIDCILIGGFWFPSRVAEAYADVLPPVPVVLLRYATPSMPSGTVRPIVV